MLYERWQHIVESNADRTAIFDPHAGRNWTFAELSAAADGIQPAPDAVRFVCGHDVPFFLDVITSWRSGSALLPLEPNQARPDIPELDANVAHLKLTSGTTGVPQLIAFTSEQLAADAENIVSTMGLQPTIPNLAVISLSHSYGFSNLVTPLLLHGIPIVLSPTPLPEMVKRAMEGHDQIVLPAVPAMWRAWLSAGIVSEKVCTAISAGAPLPLEIEQKVFESTGVKIHNFCGSSECGGIAYDRSELPRTDAALIGEALDNVRLSVNEEGCLVVESDAVAIGYVEKSDERVANGRFTTTDLAEIVDGELRITGRASDTINIAGRKLSPETIENVVRSLSGVRNCIAFGVPSKNDIRCDEVAIAIEISSETDPNDIKQQTSARLAPWQTPRHWWQVDEIRTNARGKISRTEWRSGFLDRASSNPALGMST